MAIQLIPLVAGAVIGSLATYLYGDEKIRSGVSRTANDVADKVKDAAGTVTDKVSSGLSGLREKVTGTPDKTATTKTTATKKKSKKTAAKKASKKKVAKKAKTAKKPEVSAEKTV